MADAVQTVLDDMVPALRDLLSKSIFTESEIRSIVERRRKSEYLLRRRTARKADFLRYIEDEVQLERLRSLRNRRILTMKARDEARREQQERQDGKGGKGGSKDRRGDDKKSSKKGSSIGDASIVKHVHFIYVRALRKWRDDVNLHLIHADFAKRVGSYKRLGRIYAEALQVSLSVVVVMMFDAAELSLLPGWGLVWKRRERAAVEPPRPVLILSPPPNKPSKEISNEVRYFEL